jgi:arylsulfatase A-like enzyme
MAPNILFIMSDDHAAHAISAYGSQINTTPHIDRIAHTGLRLTNCHVTNSLCTPSRGTILTGQYGHKCNVRTIGDKLDPAHEPQMQKVLQKQGYQTALVGKWHLGIRHGGVPAGFDYWNVLEGQGLYYDPVFISEQGDRTIKGYVTDITTDLCLDWLKQRDRSRPFFMCCHHKAPHRPWEPGPKYKDLFEEINIVEPPTFNDDYANRSEAARRAEMTIEHHLNKVDLKVDPPADLQGHALKQWKYQRYIKDYLRCVQSIDDSVGQLLDYLEADGIAEDTIVIYTSDQGFFLGDHGWYDKRFMYEHSLRMPFLIRYPGRIVPGSVSDTLVANHDFAPTLLAYAGAKAPAEMQGRSAVGVFDHKPPADWPTSIYYRYWMHLAHHNVASHYGVRDKRYKLIFYYGQSLGTVGSIDKTMPPEWELFDLEHDPFELRNVFDDPAYASEKRRLLKELDRLQAEYEDQPQHKVGTFEAIAPK